MAEQTSNPFKPGAGRSPAHLAGRSSEQEEIKRAMAEICAPRVAEGDCLQEAPPLHLRIAGPRGAGKTALLSWMQSEENPEEIVIARWAYVEGESSESTFEVLLDELAGQSRSELRTKIEGKIPFLKAIREWQREQSQYTRFRQILAERLRLHPVFLLLDDVMHYDRDLLALVLYESQKRSTEGWPLVLVLTGTPALDSHLRKVDGSFIYSSKNLFINELSDEAVREALKDPFEQHGFKVTDEALELMASWTSNYPCLTQAVGEMVWDAKGERTEIDVSLAEEARPVIQAARRAFYGDVYNGLRDAGLLSYTSQLVAMMDEADESLAPEQIVDKLAAANNMEERRANDILRQLMDHGLIWLKGHRSVERGLPSFFTYFKAEYKPSE